MDKYEKSFVLRDEFLVRIKWIESVGYGLLCFFLPFVLSHSSQQLLLGSIVNSAIILAAIRLNWKQSMPAILLPSLGVLAAGVLFGSLTQFLLFLVPFIWIGNALLAFSFKHFSKKNYAFKAVFGAAVKSVFLGVSVLALVSFSLVPSALLLPMSLMQFLTALLGSVIAFASIKAMTRMPSIK